MVRILFDTNIINALENVDREGRNKPHISEYAALLNMIIYRKKGKCKIFSSRFVNREILDEKTKTRDYVRKNLILHLLDEIKNPRVMYRKPDFDYLKGLFGHKDAAIVFECLAKNIDYLITRDTVLVKKAKNDFKYRKPVVLTPIEAHDLFKKDLQGYVDYFGKIG